MVTDNMNGNSSGIWDANTGTSKNPDSGKVPRSGRSNKAP